MTLSCKGNIRKLNMGLWMLQIRLYYQTLINNLDILKKNYSYDSVLLLIAIIAIANVEFPTKVNIP